MKRSIARHALGFACAALTACGATTANSRDSGADASPPQDVARPDVPVIDVALPDVPAVDTALPDLPPPPPVDVPAPDVVLPTNLPTGAECLRDDQCQSHICVLSPDLVGGCRPACRRDEDCAPMGGTVNCAVDRAPAGIRTVCTEVRGGAGGVGADPCTANSACFSDVCTASLCQNACATDADCVAGWHCGSAAVNGGVGVAQLCRPNPITGVTVEDFVLSDGDSFVDRGTRNQIVVIPQDAVSVTFSAHDTAGSELWALVTGVTAPDSTALLDVRTASSIREQPIRENFYRYQLNSVTIPSNDAMRLTHNGVYQATFSLLNDRAAMTSVATRRMRTTVRIKRSVNASVASDWALHLRVFFVGLAGAAPTAATAATNARMRSILSTFTSLYGPAGVRVVVDGYADITGADATRFSMIDSQDELRQLFASGSASTRGDVLNLFMVRGISSTAGLENAIGIAGDINGPAGVHGTVNSGVVASWEGTLGGSFDYLPLVIAHECGHYLGLWHTRERLAACTTAGQTGCSPWGGVDAIADTPTDPTASTRYLMHWQAGGSIISLGQNYVMRMHGLVH